MYQNICKIMLRVDEKLVEIQALLLFQCNELTGSI